MSKKSTTIENVRMILVLALVLLLSLIFTNLIEAPVITILVYLYWQLRRRVKYLENQMKVNTTTNDTGATLPPEPTQPPTSTDA